MDGYVILKIAAPLEHDTFTRVLNEVRQALDAEQIERVTHIHAGIGEVGLRESVDVLLNREVLMDDALDRDMEVLRAERDAAQQRIHDRMEKHCPGHLPKIHRDGKAPWCETCGRTFSGQLVGKPKASGSGAADR